jgi:hypothetical protein
MYDKIIRRLNLGYMTSVEVMEENGGYERDRERNRSRKIGRRDTKDLPRDAT